MLKKFTLANFLIILGIIAILTVPYKDGVLFCEGAEEEYLTPEDEIINNQIKEINNGIQDKQQEIKKIQDKQAEYSKQIQQKQLEKASLKNQMAILDNRTAKAELDVELTETDINATQLQMKKTDIEIAGKEAEISKEKDHIKNVLKILYQQDNVTSLEILLLNDSLADFLSQTKYLEDINENLGDSLAALEKMQRQMENNKANLNKQNESLLALKKELVDKQNNLLGEKDTKIYLLDQVGKSEKEYQRLLAQAKKEQEDAAAEISNMEKLARAKLAQLGGEKLQFNENGMIWPVTKNTVTAYFHDPDYPFRNIFEHPAIDVRAAQGTVVKAAASGYVAKVKFDGTKNYAYIMLVHGDGLSTVYGHVSEVYVKEDEYVVQGQKIGLSGGFPGTVGAGGLTTGSHLHFESRLNGIPVDPLGYLP